MKDKKKFNLDNKKPLKTGLSKPFSNKKTLIKKYKVIK